jgi:hypothetical protein
MGGLAAPYERNDLKNFDWTGHDQLRTIFTAKKDEALSCIRSASDDELHAAMGFGLRYHEQERAFWIFDAMCCRPDPQTDRIALWCAQYPQLVFSLLHRLLPSDTDSHLLEVPWSWHREDILRALLLCANRSAIAVLVGLEKLKQDLLELDSDGFCDILWFAALTVRHRQTAQEVLLTLFEQRTTTETPPRISYLHKQALSIAFDRIEEAVEEVPCNQTGWPTKQRDAPARVPCCHHYNKQKLDPSLYQSTPFSRAKRHLLFARRSELTLPPVSVFTLMFALHPCQSRNGRQRTRGFKGRSSMASSNRLAKEKWRSNYTNILPRSLRKWNGICTMQGASQRGRL